MSETHQAGTIDRGTQGSEGEIELMDYLQVIWKWKYLIVAGSFICATVAGAISFSMPKVYRISMVLEPGVLMMARTGKEVYVDSPQNIEAIIEAGTFDREILSSIGEHSSRILLRSVQFKTNIPKGSNTLKVSYETPDKQLGLRVLEQLGRGLLKRYSKDVAFFRNEYLTEIALKKVELDNCEARKRSTEQHIKNIEKRIDELRSQIDFVRKNAASLTKLRDKFLSSNTSENNMLAAVLHTNTIQHNIALENTYRQEVDQCVTEREDKRLNLQELDSESKRLLEQIKDLELKKNNVQNIKIVRAPTASSSFIKPKIKLNVTLATVVGSFVMLFVVFFLEYVQRHRAETKP